MTYSQYQKDIFDWVENKSGNAIVKAVAGSGKTSTATASLPLMVGDVIMLSFNTKIKDTLQAKISKMGLPNVRAATFHSEGLKNLTAAKGRCNVSNSKLYYITEKFCNTQELGYARPFIQKLVGFAKDYALGVKGQPSIDDTEAWMKIIQTQDISLDADVDFYDVIEVAKEVLKDSNRDFRNIDFGDMIYLPLLLDVGCTKYDWVVIDEAQDTNISRKLFLDKLLKKDGGRLLAIGDECQPTGTMVEKVIKNGRFRIISRELVPIETLNIGDRVISHSFKDGTFYSRTVEGITSRPFVGTLINVMVDGNISKYTPNHHCLVRYRDQANNYCTYIMKKGNSFRVGMSKMWHIHGGCGPYKRLVEEQGDALWILQTYPTRQLALLSEAKVSASYRIPQLMFTFKSARGLWTQEELNYVWNEISNESDATLALKSFGRLITYPYFDRCKKHTSVKRPHQVHASNLLDNSEMYVREKGWMNIQLFTEKYDGLVYSLTVEKDHNYFADNILTHNCQAIYGFTGCESDSMNLIKDMFNCIELPLSVCYRCGKSIVTEAQQYQSHIEAFEENTEGSVTSMKYDDFIAQALELGLSKKDGIICRNNAPNVSLAFALIRSGLGCRIEGKDIGQNLLTLCNKWKRVTDLTDFTAKLVTYFEKEFNKASKIKLQLLEDKLDTMVILIERCISLGKNDMYSLKSLIESMFTDNGDVKNADVVTLSSIHKAKGLQFHRTFCLGNAQLIPSKYAVTEEQQVQETNLLYISVTRAIESLVYITDIPQRAGRSNEEE